MTAWQPGEGRQGAKVSHIIKNTYEST